MSGIDRSTCEEDSHGLGDITGSAQLGNIVLEGMPDLPPFGLNDVMGLPPAARKLPRRSADSAKETSSVELTASTPPLQAIVRLRKR